MKTHEVDQQFRIPDHKIRDIDQHCKKIHAEAVVHGFKLLVTVPARFIRDKVKGNNTSPSGITHRTKLEVNPTA